MLGENVGKYWIELERDGDDRIARIHVRRGRELELAGDFRGDESFVRTVLKLVPVFVVLWLGDRRLAAQFIGQVDPEDPS